MIKRSIILLLLLLIPGAFVFGATKANVDVSAVLEGFTMSLTAIDVQMTGKTGGTAGNGIVEFGSISVLSNGKYATSPEALKIDWDPQNNSYNIQVYTSNSNESYSTAKFKDNDETDYWDLGSEANGLIGVSNPDYVAAMLWSCQDNNTAINLTDASIAATNWTYFKDYYTHLGASADGLLLSTTQLPALAAKPNAANVLTPNNRPMETWAWTWERNFAYGIDDPNHYIQGVDAIGYKKILYGTASQFYTISTKTVDESTPVTDKTVYVAIGTSFEGKPAQSYHSGDLIVEILNE
ncbi:MAG: hypothetical protein KKH98_01695 [Spirochaetes bacterium]|nr:hypothetical protein [Spirochaetota bacterium]